MEYCSLFWAHAPASHLSQSDAMGTQTFKIIEIFHDEAEYMGLSLRDCKQVGGLSGVSNYAQATLDLPMYL